MAHQTPDKNWHKKRNVLFIAVSRGEAGGIGDKGGLLKFPSRLLNFASLPSEPYGVDLMRKHQARVTSEVSYERVVFTIDQSLTLLTQVNLLPLKVHRSFFNQSCLLHFTTLYL